MSIAQSIKASTARSSMIRKMFDEGLVLKKKYGVHRVFDFSLGNPNVEPPRLFKEELIRLAKKNIVMKHGYTPNAGYPETREAIAGKIKRTTGLNISAEHLVMSCGAGGGLNVVLKALLDPGDEVIVLKPFFVEYPFYIDNYGGVVRYVNTQQDFSLDIDALGKAIVKKTKAIIINSPNNPTGRVYSKKNITELCTLLKRKERFLKKPIYLISDEPYVEIVYDGIQVPSLLKAYDNTIIVSSYSKTLSVPGERIGYIAVHPKIYEVNDVINALVFCTRTLGFVNAPALMQRIMARLQDAAVDVTIYQNKRDLLCAGLKKQDIILQNLKELSIFL